MYKLPQMSLSADLVSPQENVSSCIKRKTSSDWLVCYIADMQLIRDIYKMTGCFMDRVVYIYIYIYTSIKKKNL